MALQQVLLDGQPIAAGQERRLLPGLDVAAFDRLHLHLSGGAPTTARPTTDRLRGLASSGDLTGIA